MNALEAETHSIESERRSSARRACATDAPSDHARRDAGHVGPEELFEVNVRTSATWHVLLRDHAQAFVRLAGAMSSDARVDDHRRLQNVETLAERATRRPRATGVRAIELMQQRRQRRRRRRHAPDAVIRLRREVERLNASRR